MVENLNKLTFSGYGRVLRDSLPNRGFPSGAQWQESVQYFSAEGCAFTARVPDRSIWISSWA